MLERITIAPSIGPILGGSLSYAVGWTWIFWFLCIAAGLCLSVMVLCLPETSRNMVGNGSMSPPKYLRLPFSACLGRSRDSDTTAGHMWRMPNPLRSLTIIARRENTVIILACGILYVVYTCINTSLSDYSSTSIGLPSGRQLSYTCLSVSAELSQRSSLVTCWTKHIATLGPNGVSRSTEQSEMTWTIFPSRKHVLVSYGTDAGNRLFRPGFWLGPAFSSCRFTSNEFSITSQD